MTNSGSENAINHGTDNNRKRTNDETTNSLDSGHSKTTKCDKLRHKLAVKKFRCAFPSVTDFKQYSAVLLCGLSIYGSAWFVFRDAVLPGRYAFNMASVVVAGYVCGHTLERFTTVNAVVGMTLTGVLFRTFGPPSFLNNPAADTLDYHLRRIYPVIILTKGPLGWNWEYIKSNSVKVFSLATLPWIVECLSTAVITHLLLGFPWYWGLHLGAILASVSPAIVVPTVSAFSARGLGSKSQIAQLVANAGGLDTTFTEGMFGVINSIIFFPSPPIYRILKALLAIFVGIGLGVLWGVLADLVPDHSDAYAPAGRSLLIFSGSLLLTYAGAYFGWGGTSGVAIMVCAGTAATRWARRGWPINDNPVSEVYKLLWRIFEPMLFTLSGYFLEVSQMTLIEFCLVLACLFTALLLRMLTAFLVALANELSVKESLFIAITWIPKAIVEAVLVRVAADSLWAGPAQAQDQRIAAQHSNIIVIAILITTTLGSVLTTTLGPVLLSQDSRVAPDDRISDTIFSIQSYDKSVAKTFCPNIQIARRSEENGNDILKKKHWHDTTAASTTYHYVCLFILGLVSWGLLWSALGDPWRWGGEYFTIVAVVVTAWATGELLQAVTGLPPLLASLLTGILARHLDILDMRNYVEIDVFLRYMFPVVVLGKGALAWDLSFMRRQWARVVSLGALPWASEVVTVAICTRFLFDFPWLWGFLFGFVYSSVSGPVVMPAVQRAVTLAGGGGAGAGTKLDLARLVCTASGTDTALSVGFCGLVHAFMFYDAHITYRYVKLGVTPFVGVALGASWGCLAGLVPHWRDTYISEIRILLVLLTGLFANYLAGNFGWGGTVGVGVLVCNAVAAHYWSKSGWPLNKNPAATAYRVIWALCEPMLFTYTGTFFVLKTLTGSMVLRGLALLVVCLTVRLAVVSLVCVGMPLKHRLFVCCAFTPKAIVETVLGPLAINTLLVNGGSPLEKEYAEDWLRLLVQAIFITTPLGYLLTLYLGPLLLRSNTVATCDIGENHKADG